MASSTNKKSPTSARGWKKSSLQEDVELPSGNIARVRRAGLPELMAHGIMPDSLTDLAQGHVNKAQGKKPADHQKKASKGKSEQRATDEAMSEIMNDKDKMSDMMDLFDKCASLCIVEPKVLFYKDDEGNVLSDAEREEKAQAEGFESADDVVFTDEVDFNDKMYIFNFVVGGTRDLEKFRGELSESVASMERG